MEEIKKRFGEFKNANYFSRLDKDHILDLRIGLDEKSRKAIELRCPKFKARKITSTNVIEVSQLKFSDYYAVRFSLLEDDMCGLFYRFCEDLLESTKSLKQPKRGMQQLLKDIINGVKCLYLPKKIFLVNPK